MHSKNARRCRSKSKRVVMSKRQPYTDVMGRELQVSQGVEMDPKSLIALFSALKPGDRLEWIKDFNKHPDHVVKVVAIRSLCGVAIAGFVFGIVWALRH